MRTFEAKLRFVLAVVDYGVVLGAFVLAYWLRLGTFARTDFLFNDYLQVAGVASLVWLVVLIGFRAYALGRKLLCGFTVSRILLANVVGVAFFVLLFYFWKYEFYSRWLIVYTFVLASGLVLLTHFLAGVVRRILVGRGIGLTRILVIGTNRPAEKIIRHLIDSHSSYRPVAILDAYGSSQKEIAGVPVLGKLNKLEAVAEQKEIEMLIQADDVEHTFNLVSFCQEKGIRYLLLPNLLGMVQIAEDVHLESADLIRGAQENDLEEIIFGK